MLRLIYVFNTYIVTDVPFMERCNQYENDNIAVGMECRTYIADRIDELDLSTLSLVYVCCEIYSL